MDAINFVAVTLQLLAKNSSAALPCKRFVNKRLISVVNDLSILALHHTQIVSFAIVKLFSLFNTRAKMNYRDSTKPTLLSMSEQA